MSKERIHNEYFRKVYVKTLHGDVTRPDELISDILDKECNQQLTPVERADLKYRLSAPYNSIIGYESRRKSCPTCKAKLPPGEWVWSWGEYINAKWNTVTHFCINCFHEECQVRLNAHREECGCTFNLVAYGGDPLPDWLTLPPSPGYCDVQPDQSVRTSVETETPKDKA